MGSEEWPIHAKMKGKRAYLAAEQPSLLSLMTTTQITEPSTITHKPRLLSVLSPARTRWDLFIMATALWNCFYVPFAVAFTPQKDFLLFVLIDLVVDAVYLCDIGVYARSTYIDLTTGLEVTDPKAILTHYARSGRLVIDVFSAIPWDVIVLVSNNYAELQLFTLAKVARLLRFSSVLMFMQAKERVKLTLKLIHLLFLVAIFVHLQACLWYLLIEKSEKYTPPAMYVMHHPELYSSSIWRQYAYSLYMSVYMLTGAEIGPRTEWERIFAGCAVIVGQLFQAFMFGEIAVVLSDLNQKAERLATIQGAVATTMANMRLDSVLRAKISAFLISMQGSITKQTEYEEFFALLSPSLKQDVRSYLFESVLLQNQLLSDHERISASILHRLSTLYCQPEQAIITQGEDSDSLYFVVSGKCVVEVLDERKEQHEVKFLRAGTHFGEIALLFTTVRTATVRAVTYSTLAVIDKPDFEFVCLKFPKARVLFKDRALRYMDVRKSFLLSAIKRCPYFSPLSPRDLSEVLYSLPHHIYEEGSFLFKDAGDCQAAAFLIEGEVEVYTYLNESKWTGSQTFDAFQRTDHFIARRDRRTRRTSIEYFRKIPWKSTIVKMSIDTLPPGSVLCPNTLLMKEKAKYFAKATKLTVALLLPQEVLGKLIDSNRKIRLIVGAYRTALAARNKWAQLKKAHLLALDYEKAREESQDSTSRSLWLTKMRIKRIIMTKLLEKRRIKSKSWHLDEMVPKLRAILSAEESRDARLLEKIRCGVALNARYLVDAYHLLELHEVASPAMLQFAVHAAKVAATMLEAKEQATTVSAGFDSVQRQLTAARVDLAKIADFVRLAGRLAARP